MSLCRRTIFNIRLFCYIGSFLFGFSSFLSLSQITQRVSELIHSVMSLSETYAVIHITRKRNVDNKTQQHTHTQNYYNLVRIVRIYDFVMCVCLVKHLSPSQLRIHRVFVHGYIWTKEQSKDTRAKFLLLLFFRRFWINSFCLAKENSHYLFFSSFCVLIITLNTFCYWFWSLSLVSFYSPETRDKQRRAEIPKPVRDMFAFVIAFHPG